MLHLTGSKVPARINMALPSSFAERAGLAVIQAVDLSDPRVCTDCVSRSVLTLIVGAA